jgi:hypothetical protein
MKNTDFLFTILNTDDNTISDVVPVTRMEALRRAIQSSRLNRFGVLEAVGQIGNVMVIKFFKCWNLKLTLFQIIGVLTSYHPIWEF